MFERTKKRLKKVNWTLVIALVSVLVAFTVIFFQGMHAPWWEEWLLFVAAIVVVGVGLQLNNIYEERRKKLKLTTKSKRKTSEPE